MIYTESYLRIEFPSSLPEVAGAPHHQQSPHRGGEPFVMFSSVGPVLPFLENVLVSVFKSLICLMRCAAEGELVIVLEIFIWVTSIP